MRKVQLYSVKLCGTESLDISLGIGKRPGVQGGRGVVHFSNSLTIQDGIKRERVNRIEFQSGHKTSKSNLNVFHVKAWTAGLKITTENLKE